MLHGIVKDESSMTKSECHWVEGREWLRRGEPDSMNGRLKVRKGKFEHI